MPDSRDNYGSPPDRQVGKAGAPTGKDKKKHKIH